jgi:hypothetical protein
MGMEWLLDGVGRVGGVEKGGGVGKGGKSGMKIGIGRAGGKGG